MCFTFHFSLYNCSGLTNFSSLRASCIPLRSSIYFGCLRYRFRCLGPFGLSVIPFYFFQWRSCKLFLHSFICQFPDQLINTTVQGRFSRPLFGLVSVFSFSISSVALSRCLSLSLLYSRLMKKMFAVMTSMAWQHHADCTSQAVLVAPAPAKDSTYELDSFPAGGLGLD